MVTIRPFEGTDTAHLIELWNAALPFDGIILDIFERKVILDANRERDSLIVAETDGQLAGFVLALVIRKPIENVGFREDSGFITAIGVHPKHRRQAIGKQLLERALEFFKARNRQFVYVAPYTPNYFVPGIDKDNYPEGIELLKSFGFEEYYTAISMDAPIAKFTLSDDVLEKEQALAAEGITIRPYSRADLVPYLEFMNHYMPGPWLEDARRNLLDLTRGLFEEDAIFLVLKDSRIIGYCQYEREHFGPFGVIDEFQGKGIGSVLLARTLYQMRLKGYHSAWVLWTGEQAAKGVYARLGFTITRRFAIMKKALG
jgi:mycothiol synthase